MSRKLKTYLAVIGGGLLLFCGMLAWSAIGPPRALVISRETTYLVEPLTEDGRVDYVQAIIDARRAGVTLENNAAVPLIQSTWEPQWSDEQGFALRELGMPEPQDPGIVAFHFDPGYQQQVTKWASEKWGLDLSDQAAYEFDPEFYLLDATAQPWKRSDYPPLAAWIDDHQEHLDRLHTIEGRDHFYLPFSDTDQPTWLGLLQMDDLQRKRAAARYLSDRVTMHIGEGNPHAAWRDVKTMYLLSRSSSRLPALAETLTCYAIAGMADYRTEMLLASRSCNQELLAELQQFFAELSPLVGVSEIVDQFERLEVLERTAYSGSAYLQEFISTDEAPALRAILSLPYDRNIALQRVNERFDQLVPIMGLPTPQQFFPAHKDFLEKVNEEFQSRGQPWPMTAATFHQGARGICAADTLFISANISDQSKFAEFRMQQKHRLLLVTLALEQYRLDEGEYPSSLEALQMRVDPVVLEDLYQEGSLLRYERREDGFLLYSRYLDGVDDGGSSLTGEILFGEWMAEYSPDRLHRSSDLVVRFPHRPIPFPVEKPQTHAELEAKWNAEIDEIREEMETLDAKQEPPAN